jgi:hypothetical protein
MDFDLNGLTELSDNLTKAIRKYPDLAEEKLETTSKNFKKRVIQITKQSTNVYTGKLIKGFKLDKIQGYGINLSKNFRGTAPHFHLIENGHNQTTADGKKVGWVPGLQIVKQARDEYESIMPDVMQTLIDDITKECDLT